MNRPRVKILIGNVKKTKIGLITRFTNAITAEAIRAVTKLEIVMPGIIQPTNIIDKARANHFNISAINKTPYKIMDEQIRIY